MSGTGLKPEYRNRLKSSYLTNDFNKLPVQSPHTYLCRISGTPSRTPHPEISKLTQKGHAVVRLTPEYRS